MVPHDHCTQVYKLSTPFMKSKKSEQQGSLKGNEHFFPVSQKKQRISLKIICFCRLHCTVN